MNVYNVFYEKNSYIGVNKVSLIKFEILSAVVEMGSLTKAAETLGLTQSAVSHAISSLESEWGFYLLNRDRSGIRLTSNGERILKYIREVLQCNEQLKQEVAAINGLEVGTVRIGTFTSVSTQWLPEIMKRFESQHPSIEIKLLEGDYDDINQWIANGTVDFGFVSLSTSSKSFEIIPLKKDRMLCILPNEHPLCEQNVISFSQIEEEPFIMPKWGNDNDVKRTLKENRIKPKVKYEVVEDQAIIAMVQNGLGISIFPEMALFRVPNNIQILPLVGDHFRTIGIAVTSLKNISPVAQKFIDYVKSWLHDCNLLDY
jgi:DNA-binding transcriptional LysR family regulator